MVVKGEKEESLNAFVDEIINNKHQFTQFLEFFYISEKRIELLNWAGGGFFSDMFYLYIDSIILGISRVTDGGGKTLNIYYIHKLACRDKNYLKDEGKEIILNLKAISESILNWRNNRIAHLNRDIAIGNNTLRDEFRPDNIILFYELIQKFINLASGNLIPIDSVSAFGALDLINNLKKAYSFHELTEIDIKYYDVFKNSKYFDA